MAKKEDNLSPEESAAVIGVGIFIMIIWFIIGLIWAGAIITSLVCIGKSGRTGEKVIGVILALFTGPLFFFIYLYFNKAYCRTKNANVRYN